MKVMELFYLLTFSFAVPHNSVAFVPVRGGPIVDSKILLAKQDSSREIQEALRKSKIFGADSDEARVAWDIVEEIDASDNIRSVVLCCVLFIDSAC